jgi:hypothetical protein
LVREGLGHLTRPCLGAAVYLPGDVAVAREHVKLAQLLLSAGDAGGCQAALAVAERDLLPFVDIDDPDAVEVGLMRRYVGRAGQWG